MSRLTLVTFAILTLIACDGSPTGTGSELSGVFELIQVDGNGLPAEMWADSVARGVLEREEFEFHPDGTVIRTHRFVVTDLATNVDDVSEGVWEAEYRVQGRVIEIGRFQPCPPNAFCIPNDVGLVRNDRLDLQSGRWGRTAVYQRR